MCLASDPVIACATVSGNYKDPAYQTFVTSERAVIIWDEAHKIEHFVRQASISTQSSDIGFLVPTPQTPELAEADDSIFEMAAFIGQPKKIPPTNYRSPWALVSPFVTSSLLHFDRLNPSVWLSDFKELQSTSRNPKVLSEQDVAGYHATILAAEDEQTLSAWLAANGYQSTPELKAWLQPYIAAGWKITAFKLIKTDDAPILTTRAIRLSFHTNRPFYPYSEPPDRQLASAASPHGRALRVAILSNERMTGMLANSNPWPEKLEFAGPSAPPPTEKLWRMQNWLEFARLNDPSHNVSLPTKLTTFIDESNPRLGTADLYFAPDADQSSFQGEAVDFTLPPQNQLVLHHSFEDVAALLMLIILPVVPLYCGWKVLNLRTEEEMIAPRSRWNQPRLLRTSSASSRQPWSRIADGLIGVLAIILGFYYGAQVALLLLGQVASALLGWSNMGPYWIWIFLGLFSAVIVVATMSWGVIFCGVNVLRLRAAEMPLKPTNIFYAEGAWQGFMGASSFFAGCAALLAVESVVVALL